MTTYTKRRSGFTLVELTVVIVFGLAISSAGMLLLTQQINVIQIFRQQDFILKEAPRINHTLTSVLARADAIRIHATLDDALNDTGAVPAGGPVLAVAFRNVDETTTFGFISFEENDASTNNDDRLNYYFFDPASGTTPVLGTPSWTISRQVDTVNFSIVQGFFELRLTGPNGEVITYTISPNQS